MRPAVLDDRYRRLIDRTAFGVFRSTIDGRFVDVNQALVAMLGYESTDALLAADIAQDIYREAEHRDALIDDIVHGRFLGWVELTWRRKSGAPITVRLTVDPVGDGDTIQWLDGIVEDLTERVHREEVVRRNERMASLGKMLAGVAHELNNPLAAIGGFAQIVIKADGLTAEDRKALSTIHHESVRAAKIVKDLLTFARRPDAERAEPVDMNDVVRYVLDSLQYKHETLGVSHALDLAPQLPLVMAQASQMQQVVLNLVINARQALEGWTREDTETSTVTIRTRAAEQSVIIEVTDNGPGIRSDHKARIWDPFWTTRGDRDGSGLGLSVVHGIVTTYGGTIDVDSEVGFGTRFVIRLPAGVPVSPPKLRVVVIDDEPSVASLVRRFLASRGHTIVSLSDAVQHGVDVVISDAEEQVRRLRAVPACSGARYVLSAIDNGLADIVLEKPYELDALRRAVEDGRGR